MANTTQSNYSGCPCCGAYVSPLDLLVDEQNGTITYGGKTERFSPSPMRLIKALMDAYPNALTKEQCLNALAAGMSADEEPGLKIVDVQVCKIRPQADKLGLVITTLWGIGYRLELNSDMKAEVLRSVRFEQTRNVRSAVTSADITTVRMLRDQGYPITDIARRLKLTFKAVSTALDAIQSEDAQKRDRTRKQTAA